MKWMHLPLLASATMCVLVAWGGANAWAEAPTWLVSGTRFDCVKMAGGVYKSLRECLGGPAGGSEAWERQTLLLASGTLGETQIVLGSLLTRDFTLRSARLGVGILCSNVTAQPYITGGHRHSVFGVMFGIECRVLNRTSAQCQVSSVGEPAGSIAMSISSENVYLGSKEEAESETGKLGELFEPREEGGSIAELRLSGMECPEVSENPSKLEGDFIGEVTPVNSMTKTGTLNFPLTQIAVGFRWKKKGEVEKVVPMFKMFGTTEGEASGKFTLELGGGEWELMSS